jgi:hypothetical protein
MSTSTTPTRTELLRRAELLHAAAQLLKAHARRCIVEQAPAHAEALRRAQGMARAAVDTGEGKGS